MTQWLEVIDVADEEFDELDPMAPPGQGFDDADESVDELDVLDRGDRPWGPEAGFPDGYGVLRVWTDDTGLITKVRVSPSWRERLAKSRAHLSMPFAQAFALVNSYYHSESSNALQQDDQREARHALSWERIDEVSRELERLKGELDGMGPEQAGHWEGGLAIGQSPDKLVAIELTLHGDLGRIQFNNRKLEDCRVRQITDAVVRAHADARAQYQSPTYIEGEHDRVSAQLTDLRNELLAMMRRGFR